MDLSLRKSWKSRCFMHLANYPSRSSPTNFGDETKILRMPGRGTVAVENGEVYPNFSKDNVRYDCNKKKVAGTQLLYESVGAFHGKDSFTIQVRYSNSNIRLFTYNIDVI